MLQLASLGSVPIAFIFASAFIAPFEGGPANKLRGRPRRSAPPAGSQAPGISRPAGPGGGRLGGVGGGGEGSELWLKAAPPPGAAERMAVALRGMQSRVPGFLFLSPLYSPGSWVCGFFFFFDAAGGRRAGCPKCCFPSVLPSFRPSLATLPLAAPLQPAYPDACASATASLSLPPLPPRLPGGDAGTGPCRDKRGAAR